ncbi:hypothetical protein BGZ47_009688 [Haplosporangium gracile]|nr:hypothetical protein BGZ47_009688 [Haplosporangium gracile]
MSTTAVTNKSISLHPEGDKAVQQMDLDREISPSVPPQREDQEMQESHPNPPVNPEEPRSTESAREQEQTPDRDPIDASISQHHENANKQPQQTAVRIEHSYRHGSVEETHRQVDRPDLSYQHVQSYRHDSEHRARTQPSQQSYRKGPEQQQQQQQQQQAQVSYHYGRDQERNNSHQNEQQSSPPPTQSTQEQTSQDHSMQEGSNQDNQQDRDTSIPVSSEPSPVIKQSPGSTPPPSFTTATISAVDHEELPEASPSTESGTVSQSRPIGSPDDRARDVEKDATMLSPEPRPNNKRHSVSDEPDPADLVEPNTEAGASSSLDHPVAGASDSGGNTGHSDDESSGGHPRSSKASRKVREPVRKVPKVYPPRKPRVRPVAVEHLTMTIRTDSALSTLASAAVAIKDHQGPLSTLSVPPLSPTIHASSSMSPPSHHHRHDGSPSSSTGTPKVAIAPTSTGVAAAGAGATSQAGGRGGRASNKANIPHDAGGYRCELCPGERFGRVHDLKRHQISKHNEMTWPCDFCHRPFVRRDALLRHYAVKASRRDGVHPTTQEESRLQEAKARAKLLS